jgi:hypothetical protein
MLDKNNDLVVNRNTPLAYGADGVIFPTDDPDLLTAHDKKFRFRELLAGKTIVAHGENMHHELSFRRGVIIVAYRFADQDARFNRYERLPLADFLKKQDLVLVD